MQSRTKTLRNAALSVALATTVGIFSTTSTMAAEIPKDANNFYQSNQVTIQKVTFKTQYNMNVVGNFIIPKNLKKNSKASAIIVGHPMGAVKEQSSMLYAQKLAEQGFITLAIDLPFWGESEGQPRNAVLPDMYAEAFSAAVDYLGTQQPQVDRNRIGVLGICGSGSFVISAAKIDPRLKAIATVAMYDMGTVTRSGYANSQSLEQRKEMLAQAAEQRYTEFTTGKQIWRNYLPAQLPENADATTREFHQFYRTERAASIPKDRTLETTQNRTLASEIKFMNFYPFNDIETIAPRPVLFITGSNAHSRVFSEDAYKRAGKEHSELVVVPNATHVDLYDRVGIIPFDKLTDFFTKNLK